MSSPDSESFADPRWKKPWYDGWFALMATLFTTAFSLRTEGSANVPAQGPVLLIANHQSFIDPILVGLAARRHLRYLARKTLFRNPAFTWFIESLNALPVNQEGFARDGLQSIIDLLKHGQAVTVFPEGERTLTGQMNPFRPGVHLVLRWAPCQIVPVGIAGAYAAWPRWRAYPIPAPLFLPPGAGTVAVSIGKPISSTIYKGMDRVEVLADLEKRVHDVQARAEVLRRR
ncbi:MAG TPA: lysophospholipid acyltransferase family protein [Gemmataceae bacterium]|jgi:1-acyl-sn-glycerol-3-phosphate acyltransferase|nr:lysophospholipid acyltransferase family protein [Gemmataceae bacterium]